MLHIEDVENCRADSAKIIHCGHRADAADKQAGTVGRNAPRTLPKCVGKIKKVWVEYVYCVKKDVQGTVESG